MNSLSNKALLANLSISQWTARKRDKSATSNVESTFSTDRAVGNYTKKLLPGAKELDRISQVARQARDYFAVQTLPWFSDGTRILSSRNYFEVTTELKRLKDEYENAVSDFLSQYENLRIGARIKLGSLFNEADYPDLSRISKSFGFEVSYLPMPDVSDFRTEILDSEKDEFLKRMKDVENRALADCYGRLKDVVSKAVERLSQKDAVFRDSLLENVSDICALLPKLNINDSPELESIRQETEKLVSSISPDLCRENQTERETAAKRLAEIESRMGVLMGAIDAERKV